MEIDRRKFLLGAAFAAISSSQAGGQDISNDPTKRKAALFAASRKQKKGGYEAALFTLEGDQNVIALPGRGHDFAVRPKSFHGQPHELVVFARRPGLFAMVFGEDKTPAPKRFDANQGKHFYGHGLFSPDGRLLYSTENDYEKARGVLGVRDVAAGYKHIGELSTHGVGPHDMALLSDGRTLVIANGGIETHPAKGRRQLNLAHMEPSLAFIDRLTGDLLERHILPKAYHQLSIRHLTVAAGDKVIFGCQYKGPKSDQLALMGHCQRGKQMNLMSAPADVQRQMNQYIGSVRADRTGETIAASCPRGNMISFWSVREQKFLGIRPLGDGCGLASGPKVGQFLMTSGQGRKVLGTRQSLNKQAVDQTIMWDNHAINVT